MEAQLARYKEELERVKARLAGQQQDDNQLLELEKKLERIVALLESKVPKPKPKLQNITVKEGDAIKVLIDSQWREATVVKTKLPDYIVVNCALSGKTMCIEDPKLVQVYQSPVVAPTNPHSNPKPPTKSQQPLLPKTDTKSNKPTKVSKKTSDDLQERQQSWKAFTEKTKRQRRQ